VGGLGGTGRGGEKEVEVEERDKEWCGVRRVGLTTRHSFFDRTAAQDYRPQDKSRGLKWYAIGAC
jgi:hypothetical protein